MNIGLFGYGKMGRMLEKIGQDRGHTIVAKIDDDTEAIDYDGMDVAIDFSTPNAAFNNITHCFKNRVPVVSGTTGWLRDYEKALQICNAEKGAFIYASNFSLGVNIFFELNRQLAQMMSGLEQYTASLEEIHHIHKLDAPSGTAITLAEGVLEHHPKKDWSLDGKEKGKLPIYAKRDGEVPGTHSVNYTSKEDSITIQHVAHGREGFALGAIVAAEWILGKQGVFSMKDVLNLSN
ncbi:Dihydrodipicolinate reductase [Croceitalea dokdonensis DOKDO 023]|uniref:4-hydroxy-tetrahydrodipicolinate reductase n=1 Tax=Croceitalea dokdonensis DOKDO 023 TaxID=1300341 RepID=A0A0P7AIQ5_9FLAO|nr:4-hydroxy-tetrahydrodipicolinate reductase [Croceitalea dokdonensis]KPM31677.1 Dihydrodipicolinate reductase [Croceitalea dokdonensis DOKDO 023]